MSEDILDERQFAGSATDTEPISFDGETQNDFVPFKIDTGSVFKRLARDIYETDEAGVRELLTNAITATKKAMNRGLIASDEGVVDVKLVQSDGSWQLRIRDNGVGMSKAKIKHVVSVIGASDSLEAADLAGKFGIGFLSAFRLVGIDGGFEMYTNSRDTDSEPIGGVWKSGGFAFDSDNLLPYGFDEDEYGTEFRLTLKDELSVSDVISWIKRHSMWARVSVRYERIKTNGTVVDEDDFGGPEKSLVDSYEDTEPSIVLETEFFEACTTPSSGQKTILLDVPVRRNYSGPSGVLRRQNRDIKPAPFPVDIRLKKESRTVVDGPHKGKEVVPNDEYDRLEDTTGLIAESDTDGNDIIMPGPVGTRRALKKNNAFWRWLGQQLAERYTQRVREVLTDISDFSEILSLPRREFKLCAYYTSQMSYGFGGTLPADKSTIEKLQDDIQAELGVQISENVAHGLLGLTAKVSHATPDGRRFTKKRNRDRKAVHEICYDAYNAEETTVYMAHRISRKKARAVWEHSEQTEVVGISKQNEYETFKRLFDWKQLTDITEQTVKNLDVSDDTISSFETNSNTTNNDELVIHAGTSEQYKLKYTLSEIETVADNSQLNFEECTVDELILFPSHESENVSDYYEIASRDRAMAKCTKTEWEQLSEYDCIRNATTIVEEARSTQFDTSDGKHSIETFESHFTSETDLIFHIISNQYADKFRQEEVISRGADFCMKETDSNSVVYAPISKEELSEISIAIGPHTVLLGDKDIETLASKIEIKSDTTAYAWMRLHEWSDSYPYDSVSGTYKSLHSGGYELVEALYHGLTEIQDEIQ